MFTLLLIVWTLGTAVLFVTVFVQRYHLETCFRRIDRHLTRQMNDDEKIHRLTMNEAKAVHEEMRYRQCFEGLKVDALDNFGIVRELIRDRCYERAIQHIDDWRKRIRR